jgi:acylpyruvate hydrolase
MRFVSFHAEGATRLGVVRGDCVVELIATAADAAPDLLTLLRSGTEGLAAAAAAVQRAPAESTRSLEGLALRAPIGNPGKIVCLGLNYADHAAEGGHSRPSYPSFFLRCTSSLVAHGEPIRRPRCSEQLDYEAELVAVIGRRARNVKLGDALAHVAGYSCFNDASIRDYQRKTSQWTIGKNFDGTGAFGPAFVTADELPPGGEGLRITSRLNGKTMQDANTRDMLFPVAETIVLLSECMTLDVGDMLVMGTPAGVGHARKPPVWMKDSDVVEIEIEQIGVLRNPVRDEAPQK